MTTAPHLEHTTGPSDGTLTYQIQVAGHLDDHWADWLGSHQLVRNDTSTTTLTLEAADQAQLHGVLASIRDLGVNLLSLQPVAEVPDTHFREAPVLERTLQTERLTLRSALAQDADATWTYRRLDSANEWLTGVPEGIIDYRSLFVEPARLATTVIVEPAHREDERVVIGDFMLRRDDARAQVEVAEQAKGAQAELGWVLAPAYRGAGYATEAATELLRYCFDELEVHRVVASCFLANETSWRLMERVGMRRETHAVRESLHRSGRWLDTVAYAILTDEWRHGAD